MLDNKKKIFFFNFVIRVEIKQLKHLKKGRKLKECVRTGSVRSET
jgi:hypothetical protein